jgi:hypothetical protein
VEGVGEQRTKVIRCGACYYSIVVNAHRVTSMADTDINAVRKRNNAERKKTTRVTSHSQTIRCQRYRVLLLCVSVIFF